MVEWISEADVLDIPFTDIDRANQAIDYLISGAIYTAASDGGPSDSRQRDACREAAKVQAQHYADGLDESGSVSLGSLSIGGRAGAQEAQPGPYAVDAVKILRAAGLAWKVR